jgi:hypothetical protein
MLRYSALKTVGMARHAQIGESGDCQPRHHEGRLPEHLKHNAQREATRSLILSQSCSHGGQLRTLKELFPNGRTPNSWTDQRLLPQRISSPTSARAFHQDPVVYAHRPCVTFRYHSPPR